MHSSGGYTTLCMYIMPMNYTLENDENGKFCFMFFHNKKMFGRIFRKQ